MAISEEQLRRAVDEVLEPVWPQERRRAVRRLAYSTLRRVAGGALVLWSLGFVVHLIVGAPFPWAYFGFIALLATIVALPDPGDRRHLRRD